MHRVVTFEQDSVSIKLASMTWTKAKAQVAEGMRMVNDGEKITNEDWLNSLIQTVVTSLNLADPQAGWTAEKLQDEFDMPTIRAMKDRIFEISGLVVANGDQMGGVRAIR
jgi:hypothetical protein